MENQPQTKREDLRAHDVKPLTGAQIVKWAIWLLSGIGGLGALLWLGDSGLGH